MSIDQIKDSYAQIVRLVREGKFLEIVRDYYDPEIIKNDNGHKMQGAEAIAVDEDFYSGNNVKSSDCQLLEIAYGEDLVMSKWQIFFDHEKYGQMSQIQMVLTKFNEKGKISYEEYIYPTQKDSAH